MPFNDGIPKINCYSLTDFHEFEDCSFRFFVRHHLDRKYDIDEGNASSALGNLLDQSIKKFHKHRFYGCDESAIVGLVKASAREMREQVVIAEEKGKKHFYGATIPFLTEELIQEAIKIFQNYYRGRGHKINQALEEVGFCEWTFEINGEKFKLWGGPDCLEMAEDGMPEIVDYKSRRDLEKAKTYMDMDLMPKIYTLLCTKKLLDKGYKKARFKVRLWQDPKDESMFEEFNLEAMTEAEAIFRQKIEKILSTKEIYLCKREFCKACQSDKKDDFLLELSKMGFEVMTAEQFLQSSSKGTE